MEDDGILWPSALVEDLRGLTVSSYYGVMRWVGARQGAIDKQCYGDSFARKSVPSCQSGWRAMQREPAGWSPRAPGKFDSHRLPAAC